MPDTIHDNYKGVRYFFHGNSLRMEFYKNKMFAWDDDNPLHRLDGPAVVVFSPDLIWRGEDLEQLRETRSAGSFQVSYVEHWIDGKKVK